MRISLPDYKKIASAVRKNEIFVEEKEIKDALSWIQKSRAKFSLKQGPCQKGDWVEIRLKIAGQGLSEPEIKDNFILGEGKFIPGLEEKLEGMTAGQEKEFPLFFPENHPRQDLAGKTADVSVKIVSIQKMELPELGDSFVRGLGKFENLNELEKSIKQGLKAEKEAEERQRVRPEILKEIREKSEIILPPNLIKNEQNLMLEELKANIAGLAQISFNDYLAKIKKTEREIYESFLPEAENRAKNILILGEIAKKENIQASLQEIQEETDKIFKKYPNIAKAEKEIDLAKLKLYTETMVRNEKTFQFLENFSQTD